MQPHAKASVLVTTLLLLSIFFACRKEGVNPNSPGNTTRGNITQKRLTFESLNWVFEKDTNLATATVEIINSYLYPMNSVEMLVGSGADSSRTPIDIYEFTGDMSQTLFYKINKRQITIFKYYNGVNPTTLDFSENPFGYTAYLYFFTISNIGFTTVEVYFK